MLLDGKETAKQVKIELKEKIKVLKETYNKVPTIAIVLVGNNPASEIYVRNKIKAASFVGMNHQLINLDESITMEELLSEVERLNMDDDVSGIIVQLPLPKHLDEQIVINHISNEKDADGFGLLNKGKLFSGLPCLRPATPLGIMYLLDKYNINLEGKRAVVIGRSNIVGKPMALMLLEKNATVTIAHSRTKNLKELTKEADVLVVAIGKAKFVTEDMVKDGAVIVDVGINRVDGVLYGDVDFENVEKKASYITPVPGGVGPLTIAMLLLNTVTAFIEQNK